MTRKRFPSLTRKNGRASVTDGPDELRLAHAALSELRALVAESQRQHTEQLRDLLLAMLDVDDCFERVFVHVESREVELTPQVVAWLKNFRAVRRVLTGVLANQGVERMVHVEQWFDPHYQTVSQVVAVPGLPSNSIAEEIAAGYLWHGEVLRKALVVVAEGDHETEVTGG